MATENSNCASASADPDSLIGIGFPSSRLRFLPEEVLGIKTRVFNHEARQPATNPDLTVWALMNALKNCSSRVFPLLSLNKPVRELQIRARYDMRNAQPTPYVLNFTRSQNSDAMIRHLFGEELEAEESCDRCAQDKGALIGCITTESSKICSNCDWNRSGLGCSLSSRSESRKFPSIPYGLLLIMGSQIIHQAQSW
ncbi:hypothetical protein BGZ61DRAFT_370052 [Ilyonectria robusta]|uniref:uncharacterized protein n=1 Tax=Ilyonectria robusta TaxID=1079257 RepID=UPI001E8EEEFD|nr:uncharacterized protein BGZ61DRAFT_370052 [Ilyonectria robusta]KAH8659691.1 hypothetical protein BGZ61DRAFT_370052 [Ilyonectria robusta]